MNLLSRLHAWLVLLIICSVLLISCDSSNSTNATNNSTTPTANTAQGALPGEQIWKDGVSSYIFGTTDTGEWNTPNIEFTDSLLAPGTPNTVVQNMVKQAGFSLMRKFIGHHDANHGLELTDAELQAISNTMTNTNTQCLVDIFSTDTSPSSQKAGDKYTDLQFAQHVATMFDGKHSGYIKCSMFEIGNEPDINGLDPDKYLTVWNTFVTAMKQIRPDAKFIGPALAGYNPNYMQGFLEGIVQNHYPVPDAISWHWYPCGSGEFADWSACLASSVNGPTGDSADLREKLQSILGYQLPLGISEWNVDPTGNMSSKEPEISQFITQSLQAMVKAKLDFADEYDMQSFAGYGGLDMIDQHNQPRPCFHAFADVIKQYKP